MELDWECECAKGRRMRMEVLNNEMTTALCISNKVVDWSSERSDSAKGNLNGDQ